MPVQELSIYPNPFTQETQVSFSLDHSAVVKIEVTNLIGQSMWLSQEEKAAGNQLYRLGSDLPDGVYLLSIEVDGRKLVRRIIRNQ